MNYKLVSLMLVVMLLAFGCGKKEDKNVVKQNETPKVKSDAPESALIKDFEAVQSVRKNHMKMAGVDLNYDLSKMPENDRKAVYLLVKACKIMDQIFLKQVYSKNMEMKSELKRFFKENRELKPLLEYFIFNGGPFDRLNDNKPFINLSVPKPLGANFYPEDMKKEEFEAHIKANPADEKSFTSPETVIQRKDGKLVAVPYSEAYKEELEKAADVLKEAASLVSNASLKKFLNSRAGAFLSNNYYQSDIDWMDLKNHKIEVVIGPYEVYEDALFNYKASFEAFVTIVNSKESEKFAKAAKFIDEMEKNLPIDNKYKSAARAKFSPIIIADQIYNGGEARCGVQTTAFNLPNDEKVRELKGSKKVMLKNVSQAKFENSFLPIAKKTLVKNDLDKVSFDAYFDFVFMHEIAHSLGPGNIVKNGVQTTVAKELKELSSMIEEAKADILSIYFCQYLITKGVFPKDLTDKFYPSFLGGLFRSIRFGVNEAHGGGSLMQLNYLMEKQGIVYDKASGLYATVPGKIHEAVKQMANELLMIEATGDYNRAKQFIDKYKVETPELKSALGKANNVSIDIIPFFGIEAEAKAFDKARNAAEDKKDKPANK